MKLPKQIQDAYKEFYTNYVIFTNSKVNYSDIENIPEYTKDYDNIEE